MVTYAGKLVLAPMVRAGELPTRLLALKHGADLVWSPEIVDKKLIQCQKETNTKLNTIDFVIPSSNDKKPSTVVFRTYPKLEKNKLIFQMGTSDPTLAVEAAKIVINEVDGIDINAGCPKHFSIHSGMGAALLKTPEKLCSILSELVEKVGKPYNKPISVKIRILEDEQSTIELVEKICQTGIANLTVHCRTTPMRNREAPIRDYLQTINKICKKNNVSLIMNGAISNRTHFENLRQELGFGNELGGMIAENAESNPSVFNETPLPWFLTCKEYLSIAEQFDNHVGNTKYMLTRIVPGKSKFFQLFTRCKTSKEINYVKEQIDDKGELINDPTDYLEECRKEEKKLKKIAADEKSRQSQNLKRQTMNESEVKKPSTKKQKV